MNATRILVLVIALSTALALFGAGWKWGSGIQNKKATSIVAIAQYGWSWGD